MAISNPNPSSPKASRHRTRLWLIGLVLSLIAAACSSSSDAPSDSGSSSATETAATATPVEAEATAEPPEPTAEPAAPTAHPVEEVSNLIEPFDVAMEGEIVFNDDGPVSDGTFTVTQGAAALGCDSGTNAESDGASGVEKLWTCTSGSGSGTITITFVPFDGPWTVIDATDDFAGLSGSGEWFGEVAEDGSGGVDSLTGTMSFGNEVDSPETAAAPGDDESEVAAPNPLGFESCGQASDCAIVAVPLDYEAPEGEMTDLHVTRHLATGDRVGIIFVNPGGPGGSAEQMVKGLGNFGPAALTEQFDLVGIDPRGTGKSDPIDCNADWEEDSQEDFSPEDGFADDVETLLADFTEMATVCEETYGLDYLASITTENAARDIETIRVALGDEPLNYFGASYGTAIGSVYATLFPESIRSMVLDGAVPTNPLVGDVDRPPRFEEALLRLDRACSDWDGCPLTDVGLLVAIEQVRDELRTNGTIGSLERHVFERAVGAVVPVPAAFVDIAQGLADALDGDGELLNNIGRDFLTPNESGGFEEYSGAGIAIICADGWNLASGTAAEVGPRLEETYIANPNAGPGFDVPCDLWPVTGPGIDPVNYVGTAPILVIGATDDAITPLVWSEQLVDELGSNASLLIREGSGHTSVFRGSCIDDHVMSFFVNLESPAAGTTCVLRGLAGINFSSDPVRIINLLPGGAAELAGIEAGDRVISADGEAVQLETDMPEGVPGSQVELVIERGDEELTFTITREPEPWESWRTAE